MEKQKNSVINLLMSMFMGIVILMGVVIPTAIKVMNHSPTIEGNLSRGYHSPSEEPPER